MKQELEMAIAAAVQVTYGVTPAIALSRPEEKFGDYATNVALQLSKQFGKNPREIAEVVAEKLGQDMSEMVRDISIAGPGFINLTLTDAALQRSLHQKLEQSLAGQTIVAEYSDPNPFKVLHAGHVYTTVVGDAIAKLLEAAGADVHRVNFGGDVGLHVGKTMWAILQKLGGEYPEELGSVPEDRRAEWLAENYIVGTKVYDEDEAAKVEIVGLNKRIYQLQNEQDHDSALAKIYWTCRDWSYQSFDAFYERLGTKLEKYYPESETVQPGLEAVRKHIGTVFEESEGAVIFRGEPYGLHTRVFINREGLPTYETKDVGLIIKKYEDYHFDRSVVVTGNEQQQYMSVVLKAIDQFLPELSNATTYVPHGMVKLAGGVKMSSRKGNIIRANEVLDITADAIIATGRSPDNSTILGAVKYAFLKNRIGGDLIYDPKESVSLEGNSGPYLQYAHARARSILRKAVGQVAELLEAELEPNERSLVRKITEYNEIVEKAISELMPHHVCGYLYELAQNFNRFYEHNRVIGDDRQDLRLGLVQSYADTLKDGLELLGIQAPATM